MTNAIWIAATPQRIFEFASATQRWPEFLPHYRYVRVLEESGETRTVEMAARRGIVPLRWTARQTNDAVTPHIAFHHIAGPTRGMDVEWRFERVAGGTRVTIEHRLEFAFPIAAEWLGKYVVGNFVHAVANLTLARMRLLAEGRSP